jgi:hypothetical protein
VQEKTEFASYYLQDLTIYQDMRERKYMRALAMSCNLQSSDPSRIGWEIGKEKKQRC